MQVRRHTRTQVIAASAAAAAVLVASVAVWAIARRPGSSAPRPPTPPALSAVVARIPLGDTPQQLALGADGLWVVGERALYRIDPASNRVVATIPVGTAVSSPADVALGPGTAWVPGVTSSILWRLDRITNRVSGTTSVGRRLLGPVDVAVADDAVWVSCCALQYRGRPAGMLLRIDPRRNRVVRQIPIPEGPLAVAADPDAVWVATARGVVLRVDPATSRIVARVPAGAAGSRLQAIAATAKGIWLADTGGGAVLRLDPASGRIGLSIPVPVPRSVAVGDAGVWVSITVNRILAQVDEQRGQLRRPIPAADLQGVRGIAVGPGALWVTTRNEVVRIDPSRLP